MKRSSLLIVLTILSLVIFSAPALAEDNSPHRTHSIFYPRTSIGAGAVYNPADENWNGFIGAKIVLFHPMRYLWIGGVGAGIGFRQSENGHNAPMATFVPIQIKWFAVETEFRNLRSLIRSGHLDRDAKIVFTANWSF